MLTSAKTGAGISDVLDAIVERIRPPLPLDRAYHGTRALVVDAWFDPYRGAICLVKIDCGEIAVGDRIGVFHSRSCYVVQEIGVVTPSPVSTKFLRAGQIGYIVAGVKTLTHVRLGDTIFSFDQIHSRTGKFANRQSPENDFEGVIPLPGMTALWITVIWMIS